MVQRTGWQAAWRGLLVGLVLASGMVLIFWESVEIGFYGGADHGTAAVPKSLEVHFTKLEEEMRQLRSSIDTLSKVMVATSARNMDGIVTTQTEVSLKSTAIASSNSKRSPKKDKATPPPKPKFPPLDPTLKGVREYIRKTLWKPMHQHSLAYVPAKHVLSGIHDVDFVDESTIEWMMPSVCNEQNQGMSCTEACEADNFVCDADTLKEIVDEKSMAHAVHLAGKVCAKFLGHGMDGEWDGPWLNIDGTCGYNNKPESWVPSCGVKPNCGWTRLCPCRAPPGSHLPSIRRKRWQEYHGQWDHDCSKPMSSPTGEAPKIPRHFHVVVIQERGAWVNQSEPSLLIREGSREYKSVAPYDQLLLENVRLGIAMNLFDSVHFLDDEACMNALRRWNDPNLLRVFLAEGDLRYKADICRIAALYFEGGYYFDDDMLSVAPVVPMIQKDTEFATAVGVTGVEIFQSFLASAPCHPVLRRNMEMLSEARPETGAAPKKYDGLLGPVTLKLALDELNPPHTQYLHEVKYNPFLTKEQRGHDLLPDIGYNCEFVVIEKKTGKVLFCSRI
mmetsp:Transcript_28125/g.51419  ORF Transcript_28125/g.51419 Transcript_28125/m.51419 type:complete len:560 (+) Transcript_28125:57-1736(+)